MLFQSPRLKNLEYRETLWLPFLISWSTSPYPALLELPSHLEIALQDQHASKTGITHLDLHHSCKASQPLEMDSIVPLHGLAALVFLILKPRSWQPKTII